jgi:hypothetical protein
MTNGRCQGGRPNMLGSVSHPAVRPIAPSIVRELLCMVRAAARIPLHRTPSARSSQRQTRLRATMLPDTHQVQMMEGRAPPSIAALISWGLHGKYSLLRRKRTITQ